MIGILQRNGNQMIVNSSELRVLFDVDGTLVEELIIPSTTFLTGKTVNLERESREAATVSTVMLTPPGASDPTPHKVLTKHIDLLKSYHQRGYQVVVHSAGGYQWAHQVVTNLGLTKFVHEVATKPLKYVDDVDANGWMQIVFIEGKA